jgi:UDP-N-acetylglucosamine 1-carboxyvinyltransferase
MIKFIIRGGNPLKGEVFVRGAKNSGFKLLIASLFSDEPSVIGNISRAVETKITCSVIQKLGGKIEKIGGHTISVSPKSLFCWHLPFGVGKQSRSSVLFVPPLLYRFGRAKVPLPGGDRIGKRPLDRHFIGMQKMGVKIKREGGWIEFSIPTKLKACRYRFPKNTHTGTDTLLMMASFATGETVLENAAQEPEVDDLINFLNKIGAKIKRIKPRVIVIHGVDSFSGTEHLVIPDRNEAVTFSCAALGTRGHVYIFNIEPAHMSIFIEKLKEIGASVNVGAKEMEVGFADRLRSCRIQTQPYPGFMTDWQALWFTLMTQAWGKSTIIERIFPFRFQFADYLIKMGAKVKFFNPKVSDPDSYYNFNLEDDRPEYRHGAWIWGPTKLKPIQAEVPDIRAGATLTLASLIAEGKSVLNGAEKIERGYEDLALRMVALGAKIDRIRGNGKQ